MSGRMGNGIDACTCELAQFSYGTVIAALDEHCPQHGAPVPPTASDNMAEFGAEFAAWVIRVTSPGATKASVDYEYACSLPAKVGMSADESSVLLEAAREDAMTTVHNFQRCVEIRCERWARTGSFA